MTADAVVALALLAVVAMGVWRATRPLLCMCPPGKRVRLRPNGRAICMRCGGDAP